MSIQGSRLVTQCTVFMSKIIGIYSVQTQVWNAQPEKAQTVINHKDVHENGMLGGKTVR